MKKIGFLVPTLANGGAERVVSNLSQKLSEKTNLKIILLDKSQIDYSYRGEIIDLNSKISKNPFVKILRLLKDVRKPKKVKKEQEFDKVISFLTYSNLINLLSKQNEETIISARNLKSKQTKGFSGFFSKQLIKRLYNKADKIISISEGVKKDLIEKFKLNSKRIKTIHNPVDTEIIKDLKKERLGGKYKKIFDNPVIINIGRFSYQKGQWHLIRAFKKVKKEIPDAQLVFLGKGELETYLKSISKEIGLENNVHFLGFQKNPFKFLKNSEVFVLSSLFEGFGNVIIESMACEKPIISTDCRAGPREILAPDTNINFQTEKAENAEYGILVPVCDGKKYGAKDKLTKEENIMADEMINLLKDKKLREKYSKKSGERAKDFKSEKIINDWVELT